MSAAVIDFGLGDEEADVLCDRLKGRNVPYVIHSGNDHDTSRGGIVVPKPTDPTKLVDALAKALEG